MTNVDSQWKDRTVTDLVKVWKAVGVLAEPLVLSSEPISCCYFPELLQVDHIQGTAGGRHRRWNMHEQLIETESKHISACEWDGLRQKRTWCGICVRRGGSPSSPTSRSGSRPSPSGSRRTECNRTALPPGRSHAAPSGLFAQSEGYRWITLDSLTLTPHN